MNVIRSAAAGAVVLTVAACGAGDGTGDATTESPRATSSGITESTESTATTTARAAASTAKPPPRLVTLGDVPIAAADLHDAYFHWTGETITVAGYPALSTRRAKWQSSVALSAAPDTKSAALLSCDMDEVPDGRLTVDTVLTLRGNVVGTGRMFAVPDGEPPKVQLEECELVSSGGQAPMGGDAYALGSEPIPVALLQSAMFGWQGAVVRVVGYFGGTTTSTPGFDESRRVTSHAIKAEARGDKLVDCKQAGAMEAPESVVRRRVGTTVAGTISNPNTDVVVLDDCWFVE